MVDSSPTAFDAFAQSYDEAFTRSSLGQMLRERVWQQVGALFPAGSHILELACGTGADALWLAERGIRVTASDGSLEMVRLASAKTVASDLVQVWQCSLQEIANRNYPFPAGPYDGLLSNFGGLNTIANWQELARTLAELLRPGAIAVLVPMGPVCPWEILWYGLHGQWRLALRRFRQPAPANIGGTIIPIWYPSARQLRQSFAPWFHHLATSSLGLWLPPSYLEHLARSRPELFHRLNKIEQKTARFTKGWGDHYITLFQRVA